MKLTIIVAVSENNVIGIDGKVPWGIKEDMQRFRELTIPHPVIMGRVTYESIPQKFRPLPDRQNIIITNNRKFQAPDEVIIAHSVIEATQRAFPLDSDAFVIGGAQIYKAFFPHTKFMHLTYIHRVIEGGNLTLFPSYKNSDWQETTREDRERFSFVDYERIK